MKKFLIYIWLLCLLLVSPLIFGGDGGQESIFSEGAGARSQSLGGAFVSIADDASTVFYNPAGLAGLNYQELTLMHTDLFEGTNYNFISWVYPDFKFGGIGLSYFRIGTDDIIKRDNYLNTGQFDYSVYQFMLSYGKYIYKDFSIGINYKMVHQALDNLSDNSYGFDFAIKSDFSQYISTGIIIRDIIPPKLELGETTESTPITVSMGLGLNNYPLSDLTGLTAAFELEKIENRDFKTHFGVELIYDNHYSLRSGYDKDNFTFGAGLKYDRLKIDYAFKVHDYLEDSHRFSLSFLIGASSEEKLSRMREQEKQQGTVLIEGERKRQFDFYKEKADDFYRMYNLDSALAYYQRALAFDESNDKVIGKIAGIEKSIIAERETRENLKRTRNEYNRMVKSYLTQAESFYSKKYYLAALDMLELIFDFDSTHFEANMLKRSINQASENEINQKLKEAKKAEQENNFQLAIASYSRVMELDPDNTVVKSALEKMSSRIDIAQQLNEAIQFYNAGDFTNARRTFYLVISIDNNNPVAVEYLKKINASPDVKTTTLEDLQKDKEIWQLYLDGLRHMRNKDYQKAIDVWNKVLKAYPNNISTVDNIEQARLRLKSEQSE